VNIQEEKLYIYGMMKDITTERRQLVDMYYGLKKRLDFLNSLEERGIEDLSITGYIDLHTQNAKEAAINNLKRETEYQVEKIEKSYIIEEKETPSIIPEETVQRAVEKENKVRKGRMSREKLTSTILLVLKDAGTPLKVSEILNRAGVILDAKPASSTVQTRILPDLLEKNKIQRPMKGFYQYKF
jgi:hypothetical protein